MDYQMIATLINDYGVGGVIIIIIIWILLKSEIIIKYPKDKK